LTTQWPSVQKLLPGIEAKRSKLVSHRDYLASIKSKLQEIDTKLTEERAEIAAQTALLEADSKMREKIQVCIWFGAVRFFLVHFHLLTFVVFSWKSERNSKQRRMHF
jgi:hypothetical protein